MKKYRHQSALFRPLDGLLLLCLVTFAVLLLCLPLFHQPGACLVVETADGTLRYSLLEDRTVTLHENGYTLTVQIADGAAWVSDTTCPEEVCRRTGRITRTGESILCSRANVLLRIEGEGEYDAVAG